MPWVLLLLILIAAAFGVLGLVIKATVFVVLTLVMSAILLGCIAYLLVKRQVKKVSKDLDRRLQPPTQDNRY